MLSGDGTGVAVAVTGIMPGEGPYLDSRTASIANRVNRGVGRPVGISSP
jgi:hypothetical protein